MFNLTNEISSLLANHGRYDSVFPGYITHIRFPRFKNIVDGTRIDFTFPVTALVGANGSGKTSVLNALYGAPAGMSTGQYWFSTEVDPIEEGEGSPSRFIYGHRNHGFKAVVETRKARVRKVRGGRPDPNYWEPTKEVSSDGMVAPVLQAGRRYSGRGKDRWNPVARKVLYINFRKELSAFDKYFYFGKEPVAKTGSAAKSLRRIMSKKDQVRHDAILLSRVINSGNTSETYFKRKIATENRLLTPTELSMVSYVLGREYKEARWIRHRLFKGDGGLSIVFRTKYGRYSEAFAGSGEVAVTSCIVQVLKAKRGTLVLLDEPEVSLHPGAQERLLAFLANRSRTHQLQVVFSTHSPHLVDSLPNDAIKAFHQLDDGRFAVIPSTHPYAAFRRLGVNSGGKIRVIVEDRLARDVVMQALMSFTDQAERDVFSVEYPTGGSDAILTYQIPVLLDAPGHTLVLLDGDKKLVAEYPDPDTIPVAQDQNLTATIKAVTGVEPKFTVDGNGGVANAAQLTEVRRQYLAWIRKNVDFIPGLCPEQVVLRAAGKEDPQAATSNDHKRRLRDLAVGLFGTDVSSEATDQYGVSLLATNRDGNADVAQLVGKLRTYLLQARRGH